MNKLRFFTCMVLLPLLFASLAAAANLDDVKKSPSCRYCGMDRETFSHSRMLIIYEDNSSLGTCSLHCVATELANAIDRTPTSILVADYDRKELIDAENALWVIGGTQKGVMTSRAKWAFTGRESAEAFIKLYGGTLATFDDAIKGAYEDMYKDTKMIRERRKMRKMKMDSVGAGN